MIPTAQNVLASNALLAAAIVACRWLYELPFPSKGEVGRPTSNRRLKGFQAILRAWTVYLVGLTGIHYLLFRLKPWVQNRYGGIAELPVWLLSAAFVFALLIWLTVRERKQRDAE